MSDWQLRLKEAITSVGSLIVQKAAKSTRVAASTPQIHTAYCAMAKAEGSTSAFVEFVLDT
jgi:hypothetical protein